MENVLIENTPLQVYEEKKAVKINKIKHHKKFNKIPLIIIHFYLKKKK